MSREGATIKERTTPVCVVTHTLTLSLGELMQKAGLANPHVSDNNVFEDVVVVVR